MRPCRLAGTVFATGVLHLCFAGGLRCPSSGALRDITLQPQASVLVHGKDRRERCLPLWKVTAAALRACLGVRGTVPAPGSSSARAASRFDTLGFDSLEVPVDAIAAETCVARPRPSTLWRLNATHAAANHVFTRLLPTTSLQVARSPLRERP